MALPSLKERLDQIDPRRRLLWSLGALLLFGLLLLPALIYAGGLMLLGGFEGASLPGQYASLYRALGHAHLSAWLVVLGPALLMLLGRALVFWWRRSSELAPH